MTRDNLFGSTLILNILLTIAIGWGIFYNAHNNSVIEQRVELLECKLDSMIHVQQDTFNVIVITKDSVQIQVYK